MSRSARAASIEYLGEYSRSRANYRAIEHPSLIHKISVSMISIKSFQTSCLLHSSTSTKAQTQSSTKPRKTQQKQEIFQSLVSVFKKVFYTDIKMYKATLFILPLLTPLPFASLSTRTIVTWVQTTSIITIAWLLPSPPSPFTKTVTTTLIQSTTTTTVTGAPSPHTPVPPLPADTVIHRLLPAPALDREHGAEFVALNNSVSTVPTTETHSTCVGATEIKAHRNSTARSSSSQFSGQRRVRRVLMQTRGSMIFVSCRRTELLRSQNLSL